MNRFMLTLAALALTAGAAHAERVLRAEVLVPAPVADVWAAWTTNEGITTFFAPQGKIDLRVDGTYDVWFNPGNKPGERGAEGMRILGVEPGKRFTFAWSAPTFLPHVRAQRTIVEVALAPEGDKTRLTFTQSGWGEGAEWDRAYDYFDNAWGAIVLPHLLERFVKGPIDWKTAGMPKPLPGSMKQTLVAAAG
jgi:uncharacterized protein YndB with AHSA1/START domain